MSEESWPLKVKWVGDYQLLGTDEHGHSVVMDAPTQSGGEGSGFGPTRLMLLSLAGCTAMDIVLIMRKQRQPLKGLQVFVTADQAVEYPRYFTEIRLKYVVEGDGVSEDAVKRAIELSDEKYCSVGVTLKGRAKIITSYEIKGSDRGQT